jgi:hypothetical protein
VSADDLWSGPGCEKNPDYVLVERDPTTGIGRFRKVGPRTFIGYAPREDGSGVVAIHKGAQKIIHKSDGTMFVTGPGGQDAHVHYVAIGEQETDESHGHRHGVVRGAGRTEVADDHDHALPEAFTQANKRDGAHERESLNKEGSKMASITEAVAKAITSDPTDTEKQKFQKAVIRKQLALGILTVENVAADLALQGHAAELRKRALLRGETMSPEQAYVKALAAYPELADELR